MNILEELKVKPSVKKHDLINVKLNYNLIDDRDIGYDRDILEKKISKHKISKIEKLLNIFSEPVEAPKKAIKQKQGNSIQQEEEEDITRPTKRRSKRVVKGIAQLGPETILLLDSRPVLSYLPVKQPKLFIKVPSYFMNNREIFINDINSIFEPYKTELTEKESISCSNIGKSSGSISLLTHQKITRRDSDWNRL